MSIRKNRQMIYVGDKLRAVLANRKATLSQAVNMLAERYLALMNHASITRNPTYCLDAELYRNVLAEQEQPLPAASIALFPAMCKDWLRRHPEFPQAPAATALMIVEHASFSELAALIDSMEKQP